MTVNPTLADAEITVTIEASDDASDISEYSAFRVDGFNYENPFRFYLSDENRISGTRRHGVWRKTIKIPKGYPFHRDTFAISIRDEYWRHVTVTSTDADFPGPSRDYLTILGPERVSLHQVSIEPSVINNATTQRVRVTMRGRIPHGLSGAAVAVYGQPLEGIAPQTWTRTEGTGADGTWEADLLIPPSFRPGSYHLGVNVESFDSFGNLSPRTDEAPSHLPSEWGGTPVLIITDGERTDRTGPILDSMTMTLDRAPSYDEPGEAFCIITARDMDSTLRSARMRIDGRKQVFERAFNATAGPETLYLHIPTHIGLQQIVLELMDTHGNMTTERRSLNVPVPARPFANWLTRHHLSRDHGPTHDSDGDGVVDLLENAFGTYVNAPDTWWEEFKNQATAPTGVPAWAVSSQSHHGVARIERDATGRLSAGWWQPPAAEALGLTYTVETTDDLIHWQPLHVPHLQTVQVSPNYRLWTTATEATPHAGPTHWMRVRVDLSPSAR
jgi:hypothetical protein